MKLTCTMLFLAGCTLGAVRPTECVENAECRAAFGWGSVCTAEGFCDSLEPHPRCTSTPQDLLQSPADHADMLVFGSLYDVAEYPIETSSVELAVDQVNNNTGLDGKEFGMVLCANEANSAYDSLTQDDANDEMALYLANEVGVPAIVGPPTSVHVGSAFELVKGYDTLMISPSATSPSLTDLDGINHSDESPGLLWRTAPPDDLQGWVMARFLGDAEPAGLGLSRVGVIHEDGFYGEALATVVRENFAGTADLYVFNNSNERDAAVLSVAQGGYDGVVLIAAELEDVVAFFNGAPTYTEYDDMFIMLADGAYYTTWLDDTRTTASHLFDQVYGTRPAPPDPDGSIYRLYASSYAAAHGGEDPGDAGYAAHAYDAAWLVIMGHAWAWYQEGEITGTNIAKGLRKVSGGQAVQVVPASWPTVKASFEAGTGIDVEGASGQLDYDPVTEETTGPIEIWRVNSEGDGFQTVTTVEDFD